MANLRQKYVTDDSGDYTPIPGQPGAFQGGPAGPSTSTPGGSTSGPEVAPNQPHDPTVTPSNPTVNPGVTDPNAGANGPSNGQSNEDFFLQMMNSGKYKNPQDAIDAFNADKLGADKSGLSSNYGSSPAYYADNNTIGLPGGYLTESGGKWSETARTPENQGHGEALSTILGGGSDRSGMSNLGGPAYAGVPLGPDISPGMAGDSAFLDQILGQLQQFGAANLKNK